jgi:hypothetical protein
MNEWHTGLNFLFFSLINSILVSKFYCILLFQPKLTGSAPGPGPRPQGRRGGGVPIPLNLGVSGWGGGSASTHPFLSASQPKGLRNVGLWASPGLRLRIAVGKY